MTVVLHGLYKRIRKSGSKLINHLSSRRTEGHSTIRFVCAWSTKAQTRDKMAKLPRLKEPEKVPLPTTAASSRPEQLPLASNTRQFKRSLHKRCESEAMLGGLPQRHRPKSTPPRVVSAGYIGSPRPRSAASAAWTAVATGAASLRMAMKLSTHSH